MMPRRQNDSGFLTDLKARHEEFRGRLMANMGSLPGGSSKVSRSHSPADETTQADEEHQFVFQMVVAFLSRCFNVNSQSAETIVNECKCQVRNLRYGGPERGSIDAKPSRIFLDQQPSSDFFNLIVNQLDKRREQFENADLRPILNMVLVALQPY